MNQPGGFTETPPARSRRSTRSTSCSTRRRRYEVPHMLLAAYIVAGFLVASVYAVGWLRGRRDRLHRLGFTIPFTVAAIATPIQLFVGDTAARAIAKDQPIKFAAMEYVPETVAPRARVGPRHLQRRESEVRDLDPGPRLLPRRLLHRHPGDRAEHGAHLRPARAEDAVALAFDIMVFIGSGFIARACGGCSCGGAGAPCPSRPGSGGSAACRGVAAIVALWCGWIVTEVGRQPWIVVPEAAHRRRRDRLGRDLDHLCRGDRALRRPVRGARSSLLRALARRWRAGEAVDEGVPYAPPPA